MQCVSTCSFEPPHYFFLCSVIPCPLPAGIPAWVLLRFHPCEGLIHFPNEVIICVVENVPFLISFYKLGGEL